MIWVVSALCSHLDFFNHAVDRSEIENGFLFTSGLDFSVVFFMESAG